MNNFKIYREGRYDHKAMIAMKIKNQLPIILQKLDDGFNRLYEF